MPNHVTNIITVDSMMEEISNKLYGNKNEDGEEVLVDFNKIKPLPKELIGTRSPGGQKEGESDERYKERVENLIKKYRYSNWYDWKVANWGTKWNAYSISVGINYFKFQTAWDHPRLIVESLSSIFPTVRFEVKYADEDAGQNIGDYVMQNGDVLEDNELIEDMDRLQFACDILDYDINDHLHGELEKEGTYNAKI